MTTARLVFLVFSGVAAQQPPPPPPAPPPSVLAAHAGCPAPETVPPPPAPPNCPTMLTDYIPEETDVTNPVELTGCPFTISHLVEGTNLYFKINRTTANARVKYSWNWGAAAPPRIVYSCAPSSCPALLNCTFITPRTLFHQPLGASASRYHRFARVPYADSHGSCYQVRADGTSHTSAYAAAPL